MGMFDDLIPAQAQAQPQAMEPLNAAERMLASIPNPPAWLESALRGARGVAMGAADPSVGLAQLAVNALPGDAGDTMNAAIAKKEREYQAQRDGGGFDAARMAGNVVSPANLIAAAKVPMAATTGMRALQGAGLGLAAGLSEPVTDGGDTFASTKAKQGAVGAVFGAAAAPIAGKIGDAALRRMEMADPTIIAERVGPQTNQAVDKALSEIGISINELPPNVLNDLRSKVAAALQQGQQLDVAATLRKMDFDTAGIQALQGQITRDPMQFARELNLRGVEGVGEPISARLTEQNQKLRKMLSGYSQGAGEKYNAGTQLISALEGFDEAARKRVSGLYSAARQAAGKDLDVPLQGMAQDYADVLSRFGDKVPSGVRNQFSDLGLDPASPSNQKRLFTIEDADKLLKTINANVSNDPATNRALGELRQAVKSAVTNVAADGGPFAPAVKAAAQRFGLQESIPSLKAAAEGTVAPDDFVRRFVINGKTNEVNNMAKLLKAFDPDSYSQARAQIGAELQRAAFGQDLAASKGFAQESFNKKLMDLGTDKLKAFFSPDEISQIKRIGRVAAYIHSQPAGSAVNNSNTAAAMMNLAGRIPGVSPLVGTVNAVKDIAQRSATVNRAVNPVPPITRAALSPEDQKLLASIVAGSGIAAGGVGGAFFR